MEGDWRKGTGREPGRRELEEGNWGKGTGRRELGEGNWKDFKRYRNITLNKNCTCGGQIFKVLKLNYGK